MALAAARFIGRGPVGLTMFKGANMELMGPTFRRGILVVLILGGAFLVLAGVIAGRAAIVCAGLACLLGVNIALAHASRLAFRRLGAI